MQAYKYIWVDFRNYIIGTAFPCVGFFITALPILRMLYDGISEEFSMFNSQSEK